ncbi:isotrichodermin C-15 hydroxylase [Bimuria novae-zelandiae CBS 107.79]|uniref:Isotrichodermin C-15 hydroxylase n=1 Tax=Bimuria novae-zelandiae CBS 107.79 TaxID=1447943 RepID=A0A6A5VDD7_9PLEO|nr:isotrichodermin C-15 hydroxylase [Bimuria novae-zelandiae CBS 107.79]
MFDPLVERVGLLALLALSPVLIWISTAVYRLYLHPLRHVPGPKSWAISRIPFIRSFTAGTAVQDIEVLHRRYGPVVRTQPHAVSIAHPNAWQDTQGARTSSRGKPYLKDSTWWKSMSSASQSIATAIDHDKHARIRKTLAPAFTPRALKQQESLLQTGVALLIQRFHEKIKNADGTSDPFDIIPWFNFTAFDIFGDIGYGETFDCLETSDYHPFVQLICDSLQPNAINISIRLYPLLDAFFKKWVFPYMMNEKQKKYGTAVVERVNRRLGWEVARPDIMSYVIAGNEKGTMTPTEVHATFQTLTLAGSETTATSLSGTMNLLLTHTQAYRKLVSEIRGALDKESDITLDAIKDLPYLNACANEAMRLCPATPFTMPRVVPTSGDMVCGTWIAGGTSIFILPWAVYRDPNLWHDAAGFHPERWLPEAQDEKSPFFHDRRDALHPFGEGPRKCIGMHLAWAEIRLILTRMLWSFDYELVGKAVEWERQKVYVLVEREPLIVKLRQRINAR